MEWQTADWFFVLVFLAFIAMLFVGRGEGKSDGRPPRADVEEHERHGPKLNM